MSKPVLTLEAQIRQIVDDALNSAIPEPWEVSAHAAKRIMALIAKAELQPPAGETIRTTQDGSMEAAPETGQSPVGAASPDFGRPVPRTFWDFTDEEMREAISKAEAESASRLRAVSQP